MVDDFQSGGGLFRLDLSDVSNGVKHEIEPRCISNETGPFVIDYIHYKILIPIERLNTVISIHLNGEKYEHTRKNIQKPEFNSVKSFAMANDLFYWTSGKALLMEEFHEETYYHNIFTGFAMLSNFLFVCVKLPSAQPTPKPFNPPSNVQALLSVDRAKVSWRIPHLLGIQGRGAWQDWTYELEITSEEQSNYRRIENDIKALHYTVKNLDADTKYRFRVAAYTMAGSSPYSVEFGGQTLKSDDDRQIIWASHDGLLQSDILADNIHTLIPQQQLDSCNITSLEWFADLLYFVCNQSLYSFNRTTNVTQKMDVEGAVQTIAVDWIGRRLYWFNPSHQVITRGSLSNFESEVLFPLSARETDIKIDSVRGFLYFSTGHSVEFCHLNCKDKDKKEFYRMEAYSGKKVMGLTLDFDMMRVYWIIRGYEGSTLMSAPMADDELSLFELEEHALPEKQILGPLAYLSSRLLWLQDDRTVVIGNLTGKNLAHIKSIELNDLKVFSVIDSTQRQLPESGKPINVIPQPVNVTSIKIGTGAWNIFTITWQPIESVNYGTVFYEIRYLNHTLIQTETEIEVEDSRLLPYSQLNITMKAFTYWASSAVVKTQIYSPPAPPSQPLKPRIFMTHMHDPINDGLKIEATFRWNQPEFLNGPLSGYQTSCWLERDNTRSEILSTSDYHLNNEQYMENLPKNATLFCKVRANTNGAGVGTYSKLVSMNTLIENPIPRLFAVSNEYISNVDLDLNQNISIVSAHVKHLCYIAFSKELFWTNENDELLSDGSKGRKKLFSINAQVLSLTVDWIERILYWSQLESKGSSIIAFNLNTEQSHLVLQSKYFIHNLNVAPLNRELFWIESESAISTRGTLVSYCFDDKTSSMFLDSKNTTILVSQKILFIDTFTEGFEKIVWLNEKHNELTATDIRTRESNVVNFTYQSNVTNLIRDSGRMYWTEGDTLFAENPADQAPYKHKFFYPVKILPFFRQNYPPLHCLLWQQEAHRKEHATLYNSTDRSLRLRLSAPKRYENCTFEPMVKYTILYTELSDENARNCSARTCQSIETYDKLVEIVNLKPYTKYQFQIGISNYYTEKKNYTIKFTQPIVFQTEAGTPSPPRNVHATILSPTEINLSWLPPLEINGKSISYKVQYQTENEINGIKNQLQQPIKGKFFRINNKCGIYLWQFRST